MSQPLIMSYRPDAAAMCLDGRKRMTRRPAKPDWWYIGLGDVGDEENEQLIAVRAAVRAKKGREVWRVGNSIAIKPGRTAKADGRVMCTALRVEHVQEITEEDAKAEGVECRSTYLWGFELVWDKMYPTGPKSWDENPLVVVIEFEPMEIEK